MFDSYMYQLRLKTLQAYLIQIKPIYTNKGKAVKSRQLVSVLEASYYYLPKIFIFTQFFNSFLYLSINYLCSKIITSSNMKIGSSSLQKLL